jgi:hypothetical protein
MNICLDPDHRHHADSKAKWIWKRTLLQDSPEQDHTRGTTMLSTIAQPKRTLCTWKTFG